MYIFKRKTGGGENGIVIPLVTMMCCNATQDVNISICSEELL